MKLFVASDIHGSAYYCNLMLEAYKKEKADRILLLGDVLYHGPRNDLPKEYAPKKVTIYNIAKHKVMCTFWPYSNDILLAKLNILFIKLIQKL